jgi:hypothetical protein
MSTGRIVLVDIDHSISDASWRDHLIPGAKASGDWSAYYRDQHLDEPIWFVAYYVRYLSSLPLFDVVVLTGRPEEYRAVTKTWLRKQQISYSDLIMRQQDDRSSSPEMKIKEIKARYDVEEIAFAIEDRDDVIEAMRAEGISVFKPCLRRPS